MPEYRRWRELGRTYFFTVVTHERRALFSDTRAVSILRRAFAEIRANHPFEVDAAVILPDHLHCIWTLPQSDDNFSMRWRQIKREFTVQFLAAGGAEGAISSSRRAQSERGVWQRRYWEHVVRDEADYQAHVEYIHYNPVKHGLVACPHAWPHSSFDTWVKRGVYDSDWACACPGRGRPPVAIRPEVEGLNVGE